ncbi:MAG: Hsp20/alpha crystallin family protein [Actinomycetota bacterium]
MFSQNDPFNALDQWIETVTAGRTGAASTPLDAYRRGENVWVHLDLPGVAVDSLDIDVERNVLTVTAERTWVREEGDQVYRSERTQGRFRRQLHLGEGLDTSAIEADYHDGVLTLRLPVAERAKPRKVVVNTGATVPAVEAEVAVAGEGESPTA